MWLRGNCEIKLVKLKNDLFRSIYGGCSVFAVVNGHGGASVPYR